MGSERERVTVRFSDREAASLLEELYENAPLRNGVWSDCYDARGFLTEDATPLQRWFESIPVVNAFAACFLADTVGVKAKIDGRSTRRTWSDCRSRTRGCEAR